MKKVFLITILLLFFSLSGFSQKILGFDVRRDFSHDSSFTRMKKDYTNTVGDRYPMYEKKAGNVHIINIETLGYDIILEDSSLTTHTLDSVMTDISWVLGDPVCVNSDGEGYASMMWIPYDNIHYVMEISINFFPRIIIFKPKD